MSRCPNCHQPLMTPNDKASEIDRAIDLLYKEAYIQALPQPDERLTPAVFAIPSAHGRTAMIVASSIREEDGALISYSKEVEDAPEAWQFLLSLNPLLQ